MARTFVHVVIEPPDDHENHQLVSGERIEAILLLEDYSPWHTPWTGWKITQVIEKEEE